MFDLRPVGYVIGLLVTVLGVAMLLPMAIDYINGNGHWPVFLESALITCACGGLVSLACANGLGDKFSLQQTFLLTTGVWLALPIFGAIPFILGETSAAPVDAFFEAMSGLTTTGSTVFSGLELLPQGLLFWRALLQWFGGIGVIVVAMVFLPELRIGGMQLFRSEGFDTDGKILPRATQIATSISVVYLGLTGICALTYLGFGMGPFDAVTHAMTTIATGGFANYDASFGAFGPGVEYTATLFMVLAALPFVRYVQMLAGTAQPFWQDPQIRGFFAIALVLCCVVALWRWGHAEDPGEETLRKVLFNVVSIMTGTGYASDNYMLWGTFPVVLFFFIGLIGGCAGSTACSVKVFRYQILFSAIKTQIQRIHSPNGIFTPRYGGKSVPEDVLGSVIAFFMLFFVSMGIFSVLLGMTGLSFITSVSGAATALANVGPGLGGEIGPAGNFAALNPTAKWLLCAAMLIGRLEIMVVYALFTVNFWRV
ncbi:TrkH family potassium uptake protein [Pseudoruegeria sp. SHC-113]|uniref:TrkH family potassium uptake protein n=1 Tax=Pseudoruegeria sp. SHC-113 TaxID=2855439 RepID=UPI0021BB5986|nr:TrkH family potassium uptake protein [Pseudoruegeria sp. SHC-113]MCT8160946.1 TrkH family potassium uptake protein [Pseudoruegeria sp. SHC-113]